jgi:hypothetical protein
MTQSGWDLCNPRAAVGGRQNLEKLWMSLGIRLQRGRAPGGGDQEAALFERKMIDRAVG